MNSIKIFVENMSLTFITIKRVVIPQNEVFDFDS